MEAQTDLFRRSIGWEFADWKESEQGGQVLNKFIRLAIGLKRRGFKHYGAKAIVERLRFHYSLVAGPSTADPWKLNNNYTSRIARFAMERVPELKGFFETRGLRT